MTISTQSPARRGRPVPLLLAWLALLAALVLPAAATQSALGLSGEDLALIMLAPGLAALVLRLGVGSWFPAPWRPVPWPRMGAPVGLSLLFGGVFVAALIALSGRAPQLPTSPGGFPLAVVVVLQTLGALGEELGWRGLVQRAGEQLVPRPLVVAAAAGAVFGATHLGYWSAGPAFVATFTLSTVFLSLAMAVCWRGELWQRMLTCTLIHLLVNLALLAVPLDLVGQPLWLVPVPTLAGLLAVVAARRWARAVDRHGRA